MGYGFAFTELLGSALSREEEELQTLGALSSNQSVKSIRAYDEAWLSVPLLKEAIRNRLPLELEWERSKVDIHYLDGGRPVAAFELKGLFPAKSTTPAYLRKISKDICKLYRADQKERTVEHYAVLLPWGKLEEIKRWTEHALEDAAREECPGIRCGQPEESKPIKLNMAHERYAVVKTFRVTSA
jgi:hypothetical protein